MAYDIGPKIGIDGEAEFRAAITNINQNIKTLATEMKAVTSAYDSNDRSAAALTAQNEVLNKQITAQREKLDKLKEGLAAAAKEFGENDTRTLKWQAAVNTATADLNKMERQLAKNTEELDHMDDGTEDASDSVEDLGDQAEATGGKLSAMTVAMGSLIADGIKALTSSIVDFAKSSLEAGMAFDSTMSEVSAISGATGEQFDALREKAMEMGASTKFSATESAEAFTYMAMAGWKTEDMLDGIEGIMSLAAASGEDLATTSDIVTDALTAFGLAAEDSSRFADVLAAASSNANTNVTMLGESFKYVAPVAGSLGYSAEDTAIALGLMANSGIKASSAGTALRTLLTNMAKPTDDMAYAMNALGVSLTDSEGNMYSMMEVMEQLRAGFKGGQITQEEYTKQYNALTQAYEAGTLNTKAYVNELNALRVQLDGTTEAEQAEFAAMLAGKEGMSGLLAIVNASDADFQKLTNSIYESEGAAQSMAETMSDNLAGDITLFQSAVEGAQIVIADQLTPALREMVQFGSEAVSELSTAFQEGGLTGAMDALSTILTDGLALIISNLPQMVDSGMQLIAALAEGISSSLPELIPATVDAVLQIVDTLTDPDSLGRLIDAALTLIVALAEGLIKALPSLAARTPEIITNIVTTLGANLPKIGAAAVDIILTLASGLIGAIPDLVKAVPQLVSAIVGGFAGAASSFGDIGKDIVSGVWKGIQGMKDWIKGKVTGFFSGITSAVKGVLGIHSPSKVFAGIGGNMAKGVGKGWDGQYKGVKHLVVDDMDRLTAAASKAAQDGEVDYGPEVDCSALMNSIIDQLQELVEAAPNLGRAFVDGLREGIRESGPGLLAEVQTLKRDMLWAFSGEMAAAQKRLDRSMAQLPRGKWDDTDGIRRKINGTDGPALDYDALANAVKKGLDGTTVSMSGRKVGKVVTDYQRDKARASGSEELR